MSVFELTRDQLAQLKASWLDEKISETEGRSASYGELAEADDIVPDDVILAEFDGADFSPDDFFC